ncbi:MAG: CoA-binding protein [Lachnospiraceae bacterium]
MPNHEGYERDIGLDHLQKLTSPLHADLQLREEWRKRMTLEEIMKQHNFVVVGDTLNETKYAYRIKHRLIDAGYHVEAVGKELESINDTESPIDIIDLCIHPAKGLKLLQELKKECKCVLIQPGAESSEITELLEKRDIPFFEGCALVGLSLYS